MTTTRRPVRPAVRLVGGLGALAAAAGAGAELRRPQLNVLHLVADDLRTELSLAYNHPEVHTPHLDGLARKSMVFQNAYCQQPICSPSRFG